MVRLDVSSCEFVSAIWTFHRSQLTPLLENHDGLATEVLTCRLVNDEVLIHSMIVDANGLCGYDHRKN